MENLPAELSGLVLGFACLSPELLVVRLVSKRWARSLEDALPVIARMLAQARSLVEVQKRLITLSNLQCVQVFELQMRGLYLCQTQIDVFRSQNITHLTKDAAIALCGLYVVLNNRPDLPEKEEIEYLAKYTKCPLFGNRLAESTPSQMREDTVGALRMVVEDAEFLRVRDGVPGLINAIANWVAMFYSYCKTTRAIKKLTSDSSLLSDKEAELLQLQLWIEKRGLV